MDIKAAIHHYCNYQDRCHVEVRNKLYELGCTTPEVEENIADLVTSNVLNEERYARSFARGHFRMKQWGKQKIIQHLQRNKISIYCIKKALLELDADEYGQTLKKLAAKKWDALKTERNLQIRKSKVYRYLLQKGYEAQLIQEAINELLNT